MIFAKEQLQLLNDFYIMLSQGEKENALEQGLEKDKNRTTRFFKLSLLFQHS